MTDRSALIPLVEMLTEARVVVVGDAMLDRFVYGAVERISPEAPIPVLRIERETTMLGGAGNVVRNVVALGGRARLVAAIGDDAAGAEVAALMQELGGAAPDLVVTPARPTSIKTRYIAGSQQMLRADRETTAPLEGDAARRIVETTLRALPASRVAVLSDYGKGVLPKDVTATIIAAAAKAGKPVVVDPKGRDYGRYRGATVITPNRRELSEATGLKTDGDEAVVDAAKHLIAEHGFTAVLATRSQDGMTLVTDGGAALHLRAEAREVFDVSGAGDTVVAAVAAALAAGAPLPSAAALANVAAGIVVGKIGTAAAYTGEVIAALHHQDLAGAEAKVLTAKQALERILLWRRKGLKIGFTNGCFDLLHPGHIALLKQARAACDRLVVGLNSDSSVKAIKGPDRPIQNETARATVLASLASVDLVVLFGEPTPLALIEAFRPDVLVKGADYAKDQVVGGDLVESYGGRVLLAELVPGHSTTATIARLAR